MLVGDKLKSSKGIVSFSKSERGINHLNMAYILYTHTDIIRLLQRQNTFICSFLSKFLNFEKTSLLNLPILT